MIQQKTTTTETKEALEKTERTRCRKIIPGFKRNGGGLLKRSCKYNLLFKRRNNCYNKTRHSRHFHKTTKEPNDLETATFYR
jgi:hypothetical protein